MMMIPVGWAMDGRDPRTLMEPSVVGSRRGRQGRSARRGRPVRPATGAPLTRRPTIGPMTDRVPGGSADVPNEPHVGGALLTGAQLSAINRFPDDNPNPVLRFDGDGHLIYANPASAGVLKALNVAVGEKLSAEALARFEAAVSVHEFVELVADSRTYAVWPVRIEDLGFTNLYGMDVTAARERERLARENERLLLNLLPEPIARRLRDGEVLIADRFDDVTLLFADIVEFTRLSSTMAPHELVGVLNEVFTVFDGLVDRYRLEKVKTIGDAYMVVGGLIDGSSDHTARVVAMAAELADLVGRIEPAVRLGIQFRIGVHCGPVVAGVIGTKKFIYDIWGDTVNMASRMESLGVPGRIQVSHAVRERLEGLFRFESRGLIDVKGKGPTPTYFLLGGPGEPTT